MFSRNDEEPGTAHMIAEAILGVFIGVAIAVVWLVFKPVTVSDAPPKDEDVIPERHSVVFIRGNESNVRPSQWRARQQAFFNKDPAGVDLGEQELNQWVATTYADLDRRKKWGTFSAEFSPSLPVVRIDGSTVELGVMSELIFMEDWARKIVVHARGGFLNRDGTFVFEPRQVWIGSCPVPFSSLARKVVGFFSAPYTLPAEVAEAWSAVRDVNVEGGRMKLGFAPPAPAVAAPPAAVPETPASSEAPAPISDAPAAMAPMEGDAPSPAPASDEEPVQLGEAAAVDAGIATDQPPVIENTETSETPATTPETLPEG